jgi:hypothetical protein
MQLLLLLLAGALLLLPGAHLGRAAHHNQALPRLLLLLLLRLRLLTLVSLLQQ